MNALENARNIETNMPTVVIHNEPKQSEHEVDTHFNEMRQEIIPHIEQFVASHDFFKDEKEVSITFERTGVSSVIVVIESSDKKLVLKIPRAKAFSAGEGHFLEIWEQAGVKVPRVVEAGVLNNYPYTLMEYIDASTLNKKFSEEELIQNETFREMGETLKKMHVPKADGFGFNVKGSPEFATAHEWLEGRAMRTHLDYVEDHELLGSLREKLKGVLQVIEKHSNANKSSYCHDDFGTANLFATNPITVFDANPKFNNGYYDLARSLVAIIANGGQTETVEQLKSGYFGEEEYDAQALYSYIFLACCMKFTYWDKTNKSEQMQRMLAYLEKNKVLLSEQKKD